MKREIATTFGLLAVTLLLFSFAFVTAKHPEDYYKIGNVIQYLTTSPVGIKEKSTVEVTSSVVHGAVTTLLFKSTCYDNTGKVSSVDVGRYYYDANHWAIDMQNWLLSPEDIASDQTAAYISDSLVYPYHMKVGDTLRPAFGRMILTSKKINNDLSLFFYNRSVVSHDTIQTMLGKIPVYQIDCKLLTHHKYDYGELGKGDGTYPESVVEWFSPEYGVVARETTQRFGLTKSILQSVTIKK